MKRPPEKRKKIRKGITLQLVVGEDDDLIAAIQTIPENARQQVIKTLLRQSYGLPIPEPSTSGVNVQQLETLRAELFNEWQRWTRELVDNLPSYVQTAVETALATAPQQPAPPPVEAVQQIDEVIAQERANRLKRANW